MMERDTNQQNPLSQLESSHAHYWKIEEAMGPTSMGCCKGCGAEKEFKNWPSEEVLTQSERSELSKQIREAKYRNY